jgi:hypothetical protein
MLFRGLSAGGFAMRSIGLAIGLCTFAVAAHATVVFSDNFNAGADPAWGNQSGKWRAKNGTYDAKIPGNGQTHPVTYTDVTTETALANFTVHVTVRDLNDGGVWLRSDYNGGLINGVLLVTGGDLGTFNGFYWHIVQNGNFSAAMGRVSVPGLQGSTQKLKITVKGNVYSLYVGNSVTPLTTLETDVFSTGSAGLYDFSPNSGASSPRGQVFDNFEIDAGH